MDVASHRTPADSLVDWTATLLFAALVGAAAFLLGGPKLAAGGFAAGFFLGSSAMAKVGGRALTLAGFDPVEFDGVVEEDVLLLDDPLTAPAEDSRVVRLFNADESTPGALVARIADYLERERPVLALASDRGERPEAAIAPVDASAALHAALSNIRASLR